MKISNFQFLISNQFSIFNFQFSKLRFLIVIFLITQLLNCLITLPVFADNMKSDNYEIQMGNFNMTGGKKSSTNYKILDTVGQTAPGKYVKDGYIIRAGFPYIKTIIPFAFSISDLTIDFGTLVEETATDPLPFNTLTVSSGGAGAYTVQAFENHPLQIIGGTTAIPDTNCNTSCSELAAGLWNDNTKYGFGFNMSGNDVPTDFTDTNYYRQFANQTGGESPQTVMSSINVGKNRQATVTYKAIISGIQAAGNYDNIITFVATPGY